MAGDGPQLLGVALLLAAALGLLAGVALSRANVCMMRAANELSHGRFEAVAGLLIVSAAGTVVLFVTERAGLHGRAPWVWPSAFTVLGAVLFAAGARINAACSLGTLSRLASGDLGALAAIAGTVAVAAFVPRFQVVDDPPLWAGSVLPLVVVAMGVLVAGLFALAMRHGRARQLIAPALLGAVAALLYSFHAQVSLLDVMTSTVHGSNSWMIAAAGFGSLLAGAFVARYFSGGIRWRRPTGRRFGREFLGGTLMGLGAVMIPGATDALAFYGVPSGSPHAITAFAVLFGTIVLSFRLFPAERNASSDTGASRAAQSPQDTIAASAGASAPVETGIAAVMSDARPKARAAP